MIRSVRPDEVHAGLTSPGFLLHPPRIRHEERIPAAVRRAQAATGQRWFTPRSIRLSVLEDVFVAAEGLVFTDTLDVLDVSIREHTEADIHRSRTAIRRDRGRLQAARAPGTFLLCRKPGTRNYGHWLTEMLPLAWLARQHWPGPLQVMIQALDDPLRAVVLQSLLLPGFELPDVWAFGEAPFKVERLLVVDGLTEHGAYMSPLVSDCLQDLAARVPPGPDGKVLVLRGPGATRRFADEGGLLHAAAAAGFRAVDPGTLSFPEQVALFKGARVITGAAGAGMAGIGFALAGSEARLAVPAAMPDTFFWFLAGLRGLRYTELRCSAAGSGPAGEGWDAPLMLDRTDEAALIAEPTSEAAPEDADTRDMERMLGALFDATSYRAQPGVPARLSGEDALLHYLQTGWRTGLNPSPRFHGDAYLLEHDDVARAGMNPLEHYIRYGRREERVKLPVQ